MIAGTCGSCAYFRPVEPRPAVAVSRTPMGGECRRYAPRPGDGPDVVAWEWPRTLEQDGCGEFMPPAHLAPGPIVALPPDPVAAAAAELAAFIKERIKLCDHGTIFVTCGPCMADWLPR